MGAERSDDDERLPAIGLVLGGGGIAGYAFHCGVLAALEESGLDPRTAELVIGTSAGAIVAALLRGRVTALTIRDQLLIDLDDPEEMARIRLLAGRSPRAIPQLWTGPASPRLALRELRKGRGLRLTRLATALVPRGRLDLDPVTGPLETLHGSRWPERSLWLTATELDTGRRQVFGRDVWPPVARAVEASASLPGFFAPVEVDGRTYVDGGIGSPFNADLAGEYRTGDGRSLDLVIVVAPLSVVDLQAATPLNTLARALPQRRLRSEVESLEQAGIPCLILEPDRAAARAMGLNPMAYRNLRSMTVRAARSARKRLAASRPPVSDLLARAHRAARPPAVAYPEG